MKQQHHITQHIRYGSSIPSGTSCYRKTSDMLIKIDEVVEQG